MNGVDLCAIKLSYGVNKNAPVPGRPPSRLRKYLNKKHWAVKTSPGQHSGKGSIMVYDAT